MNEALKARLDAVPRGPGVYLFRGRRARRPLRRQGEVSTVARPQLLPAHRRHAARLGPARRADRGRGDDRHRHRGGGASPRAEPHQAPPAAVQHPAARRQVVSLHRGDAGGRVPAGDVHARAAPPRGRVLRSVCEREEGARDARRAQPRLSLPPVRRPAARPSLGDPLPRLPHRPLSRPLRGQGLARGLPEDHRRRDRLPLG